MKVLGKEGLRLAKPRRGQGGAGRLPPPSAGLPGEAAAGRARLCDTGCSQPGLRSLVRRPPFRTCWPRRAHKPSDRACPLLSTRLPPPTAHGALSARPSEPWGSGNPSSRVPPTRRGTEWRGRQLQGQSNAVTSVSCTRSPRNRRRRPRAHCLPPLSSSAVPLPLRTRRLARWPALRDEQVFLGNH